MSRPRRVLLRGCRVRPEATFDGGAHFHRTEQLDTSGRGLRICLRESSGLRALSSPPESSPRMALPRGEPTYDIDTVCIRGAADM